MNGECEMCQQVREVFQPVGRSDLICSECYVDIGTAIQLYQTLREVERTGAAAAELEAQIKLVLRNLFTRFDPANPVERMGLLHSESLPVN